MKFTNGDEKEGCSFAGQPRSCPSHHCRSSTDPNQVLYSEDSVRRNLYGVVNFVTHIDLVLL